MGRGSKHKKIVKPKTQGDQKKNKQDQTYTVQYVQCTFVTGTASCGASCADFVVGAALGGPVQTSQAQHLHFVGAVLVQMWQAKQFLTFSVKRSIWCMRSPVGRRRESQIANACVLSYLCVC